MVEIDVSFDEAGLLRSCTVRGHANADSPGNDLVCAAVSILTRTAFRLFHEREGIELQGGAPERGVFWMETSYHGSGRDFLKGAGAFLAEGFKSVSELYPEYCTLRIHRNTREVNR